jgi:exodeoxyribonuclease VII large subunit
VTLADFAADLRAPTPTAAAELAAPERTACLGELGHLAALMQQRLHRRLDREAQRLDHAALRLARPGDALHRQRERLALLGQRLERALPQTLGSQREALQRLALRHQAAGGRQLSAQTQQLALRAARLAALDPQQVLARGYAWLSDGAGRALTSASQIAVGQAVQARLHDGRLQAQVLAVHADAAPADAAPADASTLVQERP